MKHWIIALSILIPAICIGGYLGHCLWKLPYHYYGTLRDLAVMQGKTLDEYESELKAKAFEKEMCR